MDLLKNSSNEGLICPTCGDEGFTCAFVYCVKCLDVAIHRYCLDVMPKTFKERVIWYCEHCQVKSLQTKKEKAANSGHVNATRAKRKQKKERDIASIIAVAKDVPCQKHIKKHSQYKPKKDRTIRNLIAAHSAAKKKEEKLHGHLKNGTQESCTLVDVSIDYVTKDLKHKKIISNSISMENESGKTTNHDCLVETGTNVSQSADFENSLQDNYYRYALPVIDTVWRGSFTVIGKKYDQLGRIFAHLSTKACDKVFEEASMLPSLLPLEMHPKTLLWPKSFQKREPSDDSIALYFFPGDPINEKVFGHLVLDMTDEGLAMRATTKNAELLIFTSMVLPESFQRFQGNYYLWGVFRSKKDDLTSVVSHTVPNSSDQYDMSKGVDVIAEPFVEHLDEVMDQPVLSQGSEHVHGVLEEGSLLDVIVEHVEEVMGQPVLSQGSEHIHGVLEEGSLLDAIVEPIVEHVDEVTGHPVLSQGSEHIHGVLEEGSLLDAIVEPIGEHVDEVMGQPVLSQGSEHIHAVLEEGSLLDANVEPIGEHMDEVTGQPVLSQGSGHIHSILEEGSLLDAIMEPIGEHVDEVMGQPVLSQGSEHIHGVLEEGPLLYAIVEPIAKSNFEHMDEVMGQPILSQGNEHIHTVLDEGALLDTDVFT